MALTGEFLPCADRVDGCKYATICLLTAIGGFITLDHV